MKTVDVLKEARAKIEIGWCRGRLYQKRGSKIHFCAVGAIEATGASWRERERAMDALTRTIIPHATGASFLAISGFNDNSPSKKRVLAAFDETIAHLGG